ncbi:MAG: hypothetical protein HQL24_01230 [Candidatus Omnitrophica bacterium]|nr:hypothetical protein [Candidatus Omnitrophota bacterium]
MKLVLIQVFRSSFLGRLADQQHNHSIEIEPIRGTIYDRNNRPLAFNVSVYSLFANPRMMTVEEKSLASERLSGLLKINPSLINGLLDKDKYFVWIKRKLPLDVADAIKQEKIRGIGFQQESKRYYPNASLAAHIIGFANIDNTGLEGLELSYNKHLKGTPGRMSVLRDAKMRELMIENGYIPPQHGQQIVLTIDETIQYIAENALEKAWKKHHAKGAMIIVLDVKTGEILALANRPTYNLENASSSSPESRTNRALNYVYEPGSVFKIVTASAALETGIFKETDKIFCENGKYHVAGHILHDHVGHGLLTFQEVFEESSNIGVSKIAQKLGADTVYKYANLFRFGKKTGIDLMGEVSGNLKPTNRWSKTSIFAIPMGQEVTVTPLQLVCALSAIANGGTYMKPFIVKYVKDSNDQILKTFEPQVVDHVITPETAKRVTEILVGVVERGTATKAQIKGMRVAGKTGTAQKVINGKYSHMSFYATFMGFAPADNPRLAAIVVVDEPHPSYFGGTVSAPVFKEVIENSLRYLENTQGRQSTEEAPQKTIHDFM